MRCDAILSTIGLRHISLILFSSTKGNNVNEPYRFVAVRDHNGDVLARYDLVLKSSDGPASNESFLPKHDTTDGNGVRTLDFDLYGRQFSLRTTEDYFLAWDPNPSVQVSHSTIDGMLVLDVKPPAPGRYGSVAMM